MNSDMGNRSDEQTDDPTYADEQISTRVGKNGSPHTHILVHVPFSFIKDGTFQRALERSLEPEGGPIHDKSMLIQPAYKPLGKLLYNLKGTDPRHASDFGIRPEYEGVLSGKRTGFTQNLGPRARRKAPTREVAQPPLRPSDNGLSSCKMGTNPACVANSKQTHASKFGSDNAPQAVPALDRRSNSKATEGQVSKAEPPEDVIAAAIQFFKRDTRGRWHVRPPDAVRLRNGPFAWAISYADVERLLRWIWPGYLARIERLANKQYGGNLSHVPASWQISLETALNREADARRDFGRRREKWKEQRKWSEDLRRKRRPPEQRLELERKERDARMKLIRADLDKRDKASAARALMEARSHLRHGRISRLQHLLAGIAEMGPEEVTVTDLAYIVAPRGAHLLSSEQRDAWGREIAEALAAIGVLVSRGPDRFVLQELHNKFIEDLYSARGVIRPSQPEQ
jgi:hypothetical protein